MTKIEPGGYFNNPRTRKKSFSAPKNISFSNMLTQAQSSVEKTDEVHSTKTRSDIDELLTQIRSSGERLAREGTWSSLVQYRDLVRRFINHVVSQAVDIERHTSGTNVMHRKEFALISVVNTKLADMAERVLSSQHNQLALLHSAGEIFGLLVDLRS